MGIKETEDAIAFVKDLSEIIREAKADGKIDLFDAVKALKIAPSLVAAVKGAENIDNELSDLTGEETDVLLRELKDAVFSLIEAVT